MIDPTFYPVIHFCSFAFGMIIFVMFFYKGEYVSPEQKREKLKRSYPSETWSKKVDRMSDAQVHTIYMRLLNAKKL